MLKGWSPLSLHRLRPYSHDFNLFDFLYTDSAIYPRQLALLGPQALGRKQTGWDCRVCLVRFSLFAWMHFIPPRPFEMMPERVAEGCGRRACCSERDTSCRRPWWKGNSLVIAWLGAKAQQGTEDRKIQRKAASKRANRQRTSEEASENCLKVSQRLLIERMMFVAASIAGHL